MNWLSEYAWALPYLLLALSLLWMLGKFVLAGRNLIAAGRDQRKKHEEECAKKCSLALEAKCKEETERKVQEERDRLVKEALADANGFYREHADLLRFVFPLSRWTAEVRVRVPDCSTPVQAWAAVRDLIAEVQPLIATEQEKVRNDEAKRREQAERARKLDRHARKIRREIEHLRASNGDPDVIADEIAGLEDQIRRLGQREGKTC